MDAGSLCRKGRYRPFVRRGDRGRSTESFVQTPRQDGRWLRNDRRGFPQDRPLVALRFGQLEWENPLSHENRQRKLSELGSVGREPTTCRTRRGAGCNFARVSWHPVRVARCEWHCVMRGLSAVLLDAELDRCRQSVDGLHRTVDTQGRSAGAFQHQKRQTN